MNDELPEERQVVRDSQLSAMFDGELSAAECDLLARRLAKDEALRAQWSRYSMIGAALRAERGVALHDRVAWRVQSTIAQEVTYGEGDAVATGRTAALIPADALRASRAERWVRYSRPLIGAGIAASVAVMSVLWLRNQDSAETLVASNSATESIVLTAGPAAPTSDATVAGTAPVSAAEPDLYSTPAPSSQTSIAPPARLANYVVAHSEYSGPLSRRMALLSLVGTDSAEVGGSIDPVSENPDGSAAARVPDAP
jgi:sigma-E factor negative regulatory protein RseA